MCEPRGITILSQSAEFSYGDVNFVEFSNCRLLHTCRLVVSVVMVTVFLLTCVTCAFQHNATNLQWGGRYPSVTFIDKLRRGARAHFSSVRVFCSINARVCVRPRALSFRAVLNLVAVL